MGEPVSDCSQAVVEASQPTSLSLTDIQKCPKPFSIESIISKNVDKSVNIELGASSNYDKITDSSINSPSNISMAAVASLYNPWFHNYFIQQQKVAGNMLEMMQLNPINQSTIKETFPELFAKNSSTFENVPFLSADLDWNAPLTASRSIEQYFGSVEQNHEIRFNEMISSANNDYYKHLNGYAINCLPNGVSDNMEQCKSQLGNGDDIGTSFQKTDKEKSNDRIGNNDKNARIETDESYPEENIEDDIDSDCNSDISLDMSPDGDSNIQGTIYTSFSNGFLNKFTRKPIPCDNLLTGMIGISVTLN